MKEAARDTLLAVVLLWVVLSYSEIQDVKASIVKVCK